MSEEFEEIPEPEDTDGISSDPVPEKVSLFFESTVGISHQEKLEVRTDITVIDLKQTISQIFNLPSEEFHLIKDGMTLDDEDLLSNFNPVNGDIVLIIPVTTAG